jgi:Lar family restriction alleviation protein
MNKELKPCPFCGSEKLRCSEVEACGPDNTWTARLTCAECDADGPPSEDWHDTRDQAVDAAFVAWNRRVQVSA